MKYGKKIFIRLMLICIISFFIYTIIVLFEYFNNKNNLGFICSEDVVIKNYILNISLGICTSTFVSLLIAYMDYKNEENKWKRDYYYIFNKINASFIYFFQNSNNEKRISYLNNAKAFFNDFSLKYEELDFLSLRNKFLKKKLLSPLIYLQTIFEIIQYDLQIINCEDTKKDIIVDILEKLTKTFERNKEIVNILLNDLSGYDYCLKTGFCGKYNFENFPDYKQSLKFFIEREDDKKHNLMQIIIDQYLKLQSDSNFRSCDRIIVSFRREEILNNTNLNEIEVVLEGLKNNNYISYYDNITKKIWGEVAYKKISLYTSKIDYDIIITEKLRVYFEMLKFLDEIFEEENMKKKGKICEYFKNFLIKH